MPEIRFSQLNDLSSGDIHALIRELEHACGLPSSHLASSPLIHYLMQCVYPNGDPAQRVPISTAFLPVAPLLDSTVGKLPDGDVRTLCSELAAASGRALEFYAGSKLSAFLNKTLPKLPKPKKPTARQAARERIAMQRRANRR
jgi:hypothetical protein